MAATVMNWNCNYNVIAVVAPQNETAGLGRGRAYHGSSNFGGSSSIRILAGELPSGSANFNYSNFMGAYSTSEQWNGSSSGGTTTFRHIGVHAHELFHVLGFVFLGIWQDQNSLSTGFATGDWDIMHRADAGPNRKGECLSHISAARKISTAWSTATDITSNEMTESIQYVNTQTSGAADFYRFKDAASDEEFVIENRQFTGFNQFLPAWWNPNAVKGGLLVFNTKPYSTISSNDRSVQRIRLADNGFTAPYTGGSSNPSQIWSYGDPGDAFPGSTDNTRFSMASTPNSNIRSGSPPSDLGGDPTGFAITNISASATTMTATFHKSYLASNSADATGQNNSRKLVRDADGAYHLTFEANGEVYYQKSDDGGNTWSNYKRISTGTGNNGYSCIASRKVGSAIRVYVVWQRFDGSSHDIHFRKSTNGGSTWANATEPASNVGANAPLPVIVSPETDRLTLVYRTGSNLGSRISANDGSSWSSGTVPSTNSSDNSPSLAWCDTYYGSNSRSPLVYARSSPATIYYTYYRNGPDSSGWGSTKNLSQIVPGAYNSHQKPSIASSGASPHRRLHAVWEARNGTTGNYYVIIHRKATDWYTWPNVYSATYYEQQKEPSITGLVNDKAELLFKYATQNQIYKMHYNGSSWGSPVYIGAGRSPSASVGHTTAKYAWTEGSASPYRIKTSSETLSKAGELTVAYHRSVAVIDTATGAWLDLRLDKVFVKTKSGEERLVPLAPAREDALTLTPANAFTNLVSSPATLPVEAESLLVTYRLGGQNLSDLRDEADVIDIRLVLSGQNGATIALPVLAVAGGNLEERKLVLSAGISTFAANEVTLQGEVKGLANKSSLIASLGHIYEFVEEPLPKALEETHTQEMPEDFALAAYPNPFNPSTQIRFEMPEKEFMTLRIYNLQGRLVRELLHELRAAGVHTIRWNGRDDHGVAVTSGVYFIRFESAGRVRVSKLTVMR